MYGYEVHEAPYQKCEMGGMGQGLKCLFGKGDKYGYVVNIFFLLFLLLLVGCCL